MKKKFLKFCVALTITCVYIGVMFLIYYSICRNDIENGGFAYILAVSAIYLYIQKEVDNIFKRK